MAAVSLASIRPLSQLLFRTSPLSSPSILSLQSPSWTFRSFPLLTASLPAITLNIPGIISDIWEGILKAVPKKKTSHMKKRHRQLAGKALKDVKNVNTCPGCGKPKLAHTLCPYCIAEIQESWKYHEEQGKKAETM